MAHAFARAAHLASKWVFVGAARAWRLVAILGAALEIAGPNWTAAMHAVPIYWQTSPASVALIHVRLTLQFNLLHRAMRFVRHPVCATLRARPFVCILVVLATVEGSA